MEENPVYNVAQCEDTNLVFMTDQDLPRMDVAEFIGRDNKFQFNDQGSSNFYRAKYPHFDERVYGILELYSLGGIRYKQYRNHLKKLKKKGKLRLNEETPVEVLNFKKLTLENK